MNTWKKVNIDFPTIKLGDFIEPIKTTVADLGLDNPVVYGVTNIEGITQTGKPASKDLGKYIALEKDCFAYNPYRINVGSIGINELNLQGCVSPAYVVFKTKNGLLPKFLFHYIKSEFGIHLINWYGNKGGVRNALRFDDLCKIDIPDITRLNQEEILIQLDEYKDKIQVILEEIESQKSYAKQLRQNILQDAIEGKLTADLPCRQAGWRQPFKNLSGKIVPKQSCKYFAYVLECDDGSLYKGYSENLYERINRHLDGRGSEWTQKHKPISLIHFEEFDTEKEALEREKYFKSGSGREWLNEIRNKNKLDFDAEALFEEIQKEKKSDKKQKELAPIGEDDLPAGKAGKTFEISAGWKWVRLGEISEINPRNKLDDNLTVGFIPMPLISSQYGINASFEKRKWKDIKTGFTHFADNDVAVAKITPCFENSKATIFKNLPNGCGAGTTELFVIRPYIFLSDYLYINIKTNYFIEKGTLLMTGACGQKRLPREYVENFCIPIPPLAEQEEIINKVEKLLNNVVELEQQISQREEYAKKLMQSVLRDAFAGR